MDYKTKPTTRAELRKLADVFDILAGTRNCLYYIQKNIIYNYLKITL